MNWDTAIPAKYYRMMTTHRVMSNGRPCQSDTCYFLMAYRAFAAGCHNQERAE